MHSKPASQIFSAHAGVSAWNLSKRPNQNARSFGLLWIVLIRGRPSKIARNPNDRVSRSLVAEFMFIFRISDARIPCRLLGSQNTGLSSHPVIESCPNPRLSQTVHSQQFHSARLISCSASFLYFFRTWPSMLQPRDQT